MPHKCEKHYEQVYTDLDRCALFFFLEGGGGGGGGARVVNILHIDIVKIF